MPTNLVAPVWLGRIAAVLLLAGIGFSAARAADPQLVVGPNACAECHKKEATIWQRTHHFTTFRDLPNNKDADAIAEKMGVKRLKSESLCLNCHFTVQAPDKVIAGISCESCHSGARDWVKVHSGFSGKKEGQETKAEIAARWEKSEAAGMIRPTNYYALAKNCLTCHVVPNEKLVNVGGHAAGSSFELVSWSQGEVRHNVWFTKGASNPEASQARKRMLFVVGRVVELEASLIGVSKATAKDNYALKMAQRADAARKAVAALANLLPNAPELKAISDVGQGAGLKLNNEAELVAAAGKVSELGQKFSKSYDGSGFAAIDQYIPGADKFKGQVSN
ncbi:cytochrome c family protein [Bradyrhizobium diazoefficiens]|nr:cytochrome c family protein [Bradyrhizobium diazoefficiens]